MYNQTIGATLALVLLLAGTADAAKTLVAIEGTDGPGCGTKSAPCRTISRGIAEAREGGVVEVGPGRYGVHIDVPGVIFGKRKHGFSLTGSESRGLANRYGDVRVEGNIATGNRGIGFNIRGTGSPVIVGNVAYADEICNERPGSAPRMRVITPPALRDEQVIQPYQS